MISFKIKVFPLSSTIDTCAQYSKSTKRLIKLFGEALLFVKYFDIARKKTKKDNQNLIFKLHYQTELAAVEVKIKISEQQQAHQMPEITKSFRKNER